MVVEIHQHPSVIKAMQDRHNAKCSAMIALLQGPKLAAYRDPVATALGM